LTLCQRTACSIGYTARRAKEKRKRQNAIGLLIQLREMMVQPILEWTNRHETPDAKSSLAQETPDAGEGNLGATDSVAPGTSQAL
jgi:hypothetical protein